MIQKKKRLKQYHMVQNTRIHFFFNIIQQKVEEAIFITTGLFIPTILTQREILFFIFLSNSTTINRINLQILLNTFFSIIQNFALKIQETYMKQKFFNLLRRYRS